LEGISGLPLFSKVLSRVSPSLLRTIRNQLLTMSKIHSALPARGRVLEIGCGYGHILSSLAELRPDLDFLGIDVDRDAVVQSKSMWKQQNLRFENEDVQQIHGGFDLILILDVIHHLPDGAEHFMFQHSARLLKEEGRLLVKDMPFDNCQIGVFLDTYVSGQPSNVRTDDQFRSAIQPYFHLISWETPTRMRMGELWILAEKRFSVV
jgi:2-polyprenyl-3-methyl-5-hydroxy-6-metoxy-1,4-benzoquinol methylase